MGQTLTEIAETLRDADKKVQLIYAFNASGKTRLSRAFRELIDPKTEERDDDYRPKVLYYNAFTEDLFYWDNDLTGDTASAIASYSGPGTARQSDAGVLPALVGVKEIAVGGAAVAR